MRFERLLWRRAAITLVILVAGCGSPPAATPTPSAAMGAEAVFREFVAAVNAGDETRVAELLAVGGEVFHDEVTENTIDQIIGSLNCAADIVSVEGTSETITVRLRFTGTRPGAAVECDAQGTEETVVVTVRDGKIVVLDEG